MGFMSTHPGVHISVSHAVSACHNCPPIDRKNKYVITCINPIKQGGSLSIMIKYKILCIDMCKHKLYLEIRVKIVLPVFGHFIVGININYLLYLY